MAKKRIRIPAEIEKKIIYKSARTCNVCREFKKGIQIHHIDENPSNNNIDNLIVLCQNCHDEAHTKHDLSKNLTPSKLSYCKKEWENEVAERAALAMLPQNNLKNAIWTFINHEKVSQLMSSFGVGFHEATLEFLQTKGIVDSLGIPILNETSIDRTHATIYNHFDYGNSHRFHSLYCKAVDDLILKIRPIEIGAIWTKNEINAIIKPGDFIYTMRGFYFKSNKIIDQEEDRIVYTRARNIELRFYANTRHMYGNSSLYDSFSGHKFAAVFAYVKSLSTEGSKTIIHCTPISMGAGFVEESYDTPHIIKKREYLE